MPPTLASLRAFALNRSIPARGDLAGVIGRLGYVQADPIRAPARAQDLILMQRVRGYRAGDLERRYVRLGIEEDFVHNYGFVPRAVQALMHPRHTPPLRVEREAPGLLEQVLEVVRALGSAHPREVEARLGRASVTNAWGGRSSATTRALEALQYRGELRVARREAGVRVYAPATHLRALHEAPLAPRDQARGLIELLLAQYAPLPAASLGYLVSLARYGAPHLRAELRAALKEARAERATLDGLTYLWPAGENLNDEPTRRVRLLAPFDPLVWDRRRFAQLHGWTYRFEAYTPAAKRQFGYYALPLLWGERAVGWANLAVKDAQLQVELGFVGPRPKSRAFERALQAELDRYRAFLGLSS